MSKKELIQILNEVLDYAMCMKIATGYTTPDEPNIRNIIRLINEEEKKIYK